MGIKAEQIAAAGEVQRQAARDSIPRVRVVAGPGTGKSFTIEQRVCWLLEQEIETRAIAAVSFTRASALDLQRRVQGACVEAGQAGEEIRVTTLHSLALRSLRARGALGSYPVDPAVLDAWELGLFEMAELSSDARVNASATRLLSLFATAESELKEDGAITALTQKTTRLELRAFARFVGEHAERLAGTTAGPESNQDVHERLDKRLENLGALLGTIRDAIGAEGDIIDHHEGALRVYPIGNYTAEQLVHLIVGEVGLASADSLILREDEFRALAAEVKEFTDEVEEGWPSIVRTVEGEDGFLNVRMTDFPVVELGALGASLDMLREDNAKEAMLNLMRARSLRAVRFGEADAAFAVVGGTSRNGLDQLPEADIEIDTDLLGSEPIDYWATVTDTIEQFGEGKEMFRGAVQSAKVSDRVAKLVCEGATALTEHSSGDMIALGMNQFELISALMEQAGVQSEFRLSEEPEQPQPETFEVWAPLEGLTVAEPIEIAGITVVPPARALARLDGLQVEQEGDTARSLSEEFRTGASYALARVDSEMPNRAEDGGLARIDLALAWIATRGRYGAALMPDGKPQSFDRQAGRLTARRGRVVFVYGTETKRTWLRWPEEGDDVCRAQTGGGLDVPAAGAPSGNRD